MKWHELLQSAETAERDGLPKQAEEFFDQAVQSAQTEFGPFDVNLAKCLLAFAQFLESQRRYTDALLRYKLAAGVYRQVGYGAAQQLAAGKVARMELLIAQQTG